MKRVNSLTLGGQESEGEAVEEDERYEKEFTRRCWTKKVELHF